MQYLTFGPFLAQAAAGAVIACTAAAAVAAPAIARRDGAAAVRTASRVLLVIGVLFILELTLRGTTSDTGSLNLVPTQGVAESIKTTDLRNGMENLFGNIVLFIPLGFLAVLALRRSLVLIVGLGAALSLLIETAQFVLGDRWSDIDDVLLNTTGTLLGALAATAAVAAARRRAARRSPDRMNSRS